MQKTLSLRIPAELSDRIDAEVRRLRMKDGSDVSKAEVVRKALEQYLAGKGQ